MVPRACEPAGAGHFHTLPPHRSLARRLLTQLSVTRGNPDTFPLEAEPGVLRLHSVVYVVGLDSAVSKPRSESLCGAERVAGGRVLLGHITALLREGALWYGQEGVHTTPMASPCSIGCAGFRTPKCNAVSHNLTSLITLKPDTC